MKMQNKIAVADMRFRYWQTTSPKEDDQQKQLEMHGLENLLTQKLIKTRGLCRKELTKAVMEEQDVQWDTGKGDEEKLAEISRRFSRWSEERARLIGLVQEEAS